MQNNEAKIITDFLCQHVSRTIFFWMKLKSHFCTGIQFQKNKSNVKMCECRIIWDPIQSFLCLNQNLLVLCAFYKLTLLIKNCFPKNKTTRFQLIYWNQKVSFRCLLNFMFEFMSILDNVWKVWDSAPNDVLFCSHCALLCFLKRHYLNLVS